MPVFAGARGKPRPTSCLSCLRQLGGALLMYAADYDDTYPYDLKPPMPAGPGARPAYDGTNGWVASPAVATTRVLAIRPTCWNHPTLAASGGGAARWVRLV